MWPLATCRWVLGGGGGMAAESSTRPYPAHGRLRQVWRQVNTLKPGRAFEYLDEEALAARRQTQRTTIWQRSLKQRRLPSWHSCPVGRARSRLREFRDLVQRMILIVQRPRLKMEHDAAL